MRGILDMITAFDTGILPKKVSRLLLLLLPHIYLVTHPDQKGHPPRYQF
jgi:hypothetical protein